MHDLQCANGLDRCANTAMRDYLLDALPSRIASSMEIYLAFASVRLGNTPISIAARHEVTDLSGIYQLVFLTQRLHPPDIDVPPGEPHHPEASRPTH